MALPSLLYICEPEAGKPCWAMFPTRVSIGCRLPRLKLTAASCHGIQRIWKRFRGAEHLVYNVRSDDWDSFGSGVRTVVLGGSIALNTFITGEAHDWSGERFPAGPFLAPAVNGLHHGCHSYLRHQFSYFRKSKEALSSEIGRNSSERINELEKLVFTCK